MIRLRNAGRTLGLNRQLSRLHRRGYEERFQTAMFAAIAPGSCVWDVGANVGLYATRFSEIVGRAGRVFAFEPSPSNLGRLRAAVASLQNVIVVPVALGSREGVAQLEQGTDPLGATSRIVEEAGGLAKETFAISLATGDHLIASGMVAAPHVIKIDTEGFELDVLRGLRQTLQHLDLRVLCIEVHFGLLEARGLRNAPTDIEAVLSGAGFSLAWPDASHVVASRAKDI